MSTAKRKRKKEGRKIRQEALASARKKAQMRRRFTTLTIIMVLIVGIVLISTSGGSKKKKVASASVPSTVTTSATPIAAVCPPADGSAARQTSFTAAPDKLCIDAAKTYTATMETDAGTIKLTLDAKKAPNTVNNFVFLSRYHFYDGLTFHRVLKDFMVQGGDPQGTGSGGPGYKFNDELPASASEYKAGSLAMANSGPNTNGSQFFIVVSDNGGSKLQASYSLFGSVTEGMDIVHKIEADGADADPTPPKVVHVIKSVTIAES